MEVTEDTAWISICTNQLSFFILSLESCKWMWLKLYPKRVVRRNLQLYNVLFKIRWALMSGTRAFVCSYTHARGLVSITICVCSVYEFMNWKYSHWVYYRIHRNGLRWARFNFLFAFYFSLRKGQFYFSKISDISRQLQRSTYLNIPFLCYIDKCVVWLYIQSHWDYMILPSLNSRSLDLNVLHVWRTKKDILVFLGL